MGKLLTRKQHVVRWFVISALLVCALDFIMCYGFSKCVPLITLKYKICAVYSFMVIVVIHAFINGICAFIISSELVGNEDIISSDSVYRYSFLWSCILCISALSTLYFQHLDIDGLKWIMLMDIAIWVLSLKHVSALYVCIRINKTIRR